MDRHPTKQCTTQIVHLSFNYYVHFNVVTCTCYFKLNVWSILFYLVYEMMNIRKKHVIPYKCIDHYDFLSSTLCSFPSASCFRYNGLSLVYFMFVLILPLLPNPSLVTLKGERHSHVTIWHVTNDANLIQIFIFIVNPQKIQTNTTSRKGDPNPTHPRSPNISKNENKDTIK